MKTELGKLVSEGRKKEFAAFGWDPADVPDPQARATFERSKLNWAERSQGQHAEMLDWYRRLIALRRSAPELTDGDLAEVQARFSEGEHWMVMERGPWTVAFSLAQQPVTLEVRRESEIALGSSAEIVLRGSQLTLPPDSVGILRSGAEDNVQ